MRLGVSRRQNSCKLDRGCRGPAALHSEISRIRILLILVLRLEYLETLCPPPSILQDG